MTGQQVWVTDTQGGYMYSDQLSTELRHAVQPLCKFRQFCDAEDGTEEGYGKALHSGELFTWNVYSDIATQGGTLIETSTMAESNFTITQGTLTVTEYGNSVPYTGKLDNLSLHPVKSVINKVLKNDAMKAFDIGAHAQFDNTLLRAVPTGGTATDSIVLTEDGTATATNNVAMGKEHVKAIVDTMKERDIPAYMNDDYMAISHISTFRPFKNDLETIHQNVSEGMQLIFNGETGRYEGTRFIEQTQIPKGGAANSTTWNASTKTADAWDNGKSSWAFFFGADTVTEAIVIPEEMRGKIPGDYGRSKGIAWYYLGGFGLVHSSDADQARIVKWDSAA